jgi:2-haloacid dehalogenase
MTTTLGFDVYGTLIDTHGVVHSLAKHVGPHALAFSNAWRAKQLEYSFRRGLMKQYQTFAICTSQALDYTCSQFKVPIEQEARRQLLEEYQALPPFQDAMEGLARAKQSGFKLFAFSNGNGSEVEALLEHAELRDWFIDVVSVDEVKSFKPDPYVYAHFLKRADASGDDAWLISSNPFDVIGSLSAGMRSVWVQRSPEALFDPWGIEPTLTVQGLSNLADQILSWENN